MSELSDKFIQLGNLCCDIARELENMESRLANAEANSQINKHAMKSIAKTITDIYSND